MSEHDQQVMVVRWFKMQYPKYKDCIMSIPNGSVINGQANSKVFARLKWMIAEGFKAGASDLFIAVPRGGKHGMWVEMKDIKKTLSSVTEAQIDHIECMKESGYEAIWAAGFDIAKAAIHTYMSQDENN